ncbi:MAG: VCBS repeat-containing protein [Deltaproteobacteria bacterium]|nr:VCBS repeat-containing protein [Deltaproteobacteria bacterium]
MKWTAWSVAALLVLGGSCKKKGEEPPASVPAPAAEAGAPVGPAATPDAMASSPAVPDDAGATAPPPSAPPPVLLVTQSRFVTELQPDGTTKQKPGPATLIVLRQAGAEWEPETIEDPDSNVFHKAMVFDPDGKGPAVLTIGAMGAYLKAWRKDGEEWTATTLWHPTFGGSFDRLRDVEIGDVTGDGISEIVIATHDQGVVGVLRQVDGAWQATELDRRPGIFVHEVEIGDIDGDGKNEFFTTPSQPNTSSGEQQGGGIDMYRWDGSTFVRTPVMWSDAAHAKEILVADLDGDGKAALLAVLEAKTEAGKDCTKDPAMVPLRIVLYEPDGNGGFAERTPTTLPDCMCRFLTWGDVDGDGTNELVAATKSAGVWLLRRPERGEGTAELIDGESGGFEHATLVADLDGDGVSEIVVAADNQGALRRYRWNPGSRSFDRETIFDLGTDQITWNVTAGILP